MLEAFPLTDETGISKGRKTMKIENGKIYTFNTIDTELLKYSGQMANVIRPLAEDEADICEVGNMYKIRFADGYETDAFEDELTH